MEKQCYWIWLSRIENINTIVLYQLLEKYKEPENIWKLNFTQLVKEGLDFYTAQSIIEPVYRENLEKYLVYMKKNHIELITYRDKQYPKLLRNISDFPIVLYVKGNKEIFNQDIIAIVGCRRCTSYGEQIAKKFSYDLAKRNISVISGMAKSLIVIEAKIKSGTFITVDFALEQGKDIYAVPGNINSSCSEGTNELLKQGAIPITKIDDIIF